MIGSSSSCRKNWRARFVETKKNLKSPVQQAYVGQQKVARVALVLCKILNREIPCHVRDKRRFFEPIQHMTELSFGCGLQAYLGRMNQSTGRPLIKGFTRIRFNGITVGYFLFNPCRDLSIMQEQYS